MTAPQQADLTAALQILAQGQVNLQAMVQAQNEANAVQRNEMSMLREQIQRQNEQLNIQAEELRKSVESKGHRNLLDTKGLGKPSTFSGQATDWEAWKFKFVTWMSAQFEDAESLLDWAESSSGAVTPTEMTDLELQYRQAVEFNSQLYGVLVSLFDLASEPMEIVRNSSKGMGLDAWRRLCAKYDPSNPQTNLVLLKKVLNPPRSSMDHLQSNLERWEREVRTYCARSRETITGSIRKMLLHSLVPERVQEHLEIHGAKLLTYDETRAEVVRLIESHTTRVVTGAVPMELDSVASNKGKVGGKPRDACSRCGKKGHFARDCTAFLGECGNCGVWGHKRADCRKPGGGAHGRQLGGDPQRTGGSRPKPGAGPKAKGKGKGKKLDSVEKESVKRRESTGIPRRANTASRNTPRGMRMSVKTR